MTNAPRTEGATTNDIVAANITRIRERKGWNFSRLSTRLQDVGHPLAITSLQRIERGTRRVDVNDLTAISIALGVTPAYLMTPYQSDPQSRNEEIVSPLTGLPPATANEVTAWLTDNLLDFEITHTLIWNLTQMKHLEEEMSDIETQIQDVAGEDLESRAEQHMLKGDRLRMEMEMESYRERAEELEDQRKNRNI